MNVHGLSHGYVCANSTLRRPVAKLSENVVIKIPMCTEGLKATKILASMDMPIALPGDTSVVTSLSIGIAVFPDHGVTPGALLNAADAAMYQAKRLSRGAQFTAGSESPVVNLQTRS